ncbi:MAG: hypothetical protein JXQ96_16585 [Cyclobacteriaceae bacterium]
MALIITIPGYAQKFEVNELTEKNPSFPQQVYSFPILTGMNQKVVSDINSYLIKDQLRLDYGEEKNSIFENIWQTETRLMPATSDMSFKLELLDSKLYSVTMLGEFCGAYCEQYSMTYNFDLETGEILDLQSLFTQKGQKKLAKQLSDQKRNIISDKLKEVQLILNSESVSDEDSEYYGNMNWIYKDCLEFGVELEYLNFIPKNQKLELSLGRCSNHANRSVDELGDFHFEIDLKKWKSSLSELGKRILL